MTLNQIASSTGLRLRSIRYVLDQDLLPGTPQVVKAEERGQPRTVSKDDAFIIAIAVHLLDAGLKRNVVRVMIQKLVEFPGRFSKAAELNPLRAIQCSRGSSMLTVNGQSEIVKLTLGKQSLPISQVHTSPPTAVLLQIDLAMIRDRVFRTIGNPGG